MDFTLSAEQLMIKDSVTRFAAEPPKGDPWTTFAELGWLALGAPEDLGGFGGPLETMILMEAFGKGLVTAPYLAQVVLAGSILRLAARTDLLQPLVDGSARLPSPTKSRTRATIRRALRRLECLRAMATYWAAARCVCSARAAPRR